MPNAFITKVKNLWAKPSKPVKIALGAALVILLAGVLVRTFAGTQQLAVLQAEDMRITSGQGSIEQPNDRHPNATLLKLTSSGATASGTINTSTRGNKLEVRARGEQCEGSPQLRITIDGNEAALINVSKSYLQFFENDYTLPAGEHRIVATFANDATPANANCRRDIAIDWIKIHAETTTTTDTTAPTTSITSPASGANVSGTVSVNANAADNVGVSRVELLDGTRVVGTDSTSPYSFAWNTSNAGNGSHTLKTKAYDAAGNLGQSANVTVNVSGSSSTAAIMRTDHVLDVWGLNIKITYANGTHGNTDANYNKLKQLTDEMGLRVYRQELQTANTVGKTRQRDWMRTMNTNHGTRFHVTIGQMRNKDGFNKDWSAAQVRAYAKRDTSEDLNELATYWKSIAPGGDLSRIIHSIAGPNEIEERNPNDNTGPNWARNARIWQQEIYEQVRGRDNSTYRTVFANIPVCVPSTRTDLRIETAREAAFAQPGDGSEDMPQNADCGNAHLYQRGVGPTEADTNDMKTKQSPMVGGTNKPYVFSETGYNNMTNNVEGRYVGPSTVIPYGQGRGFKRNPPWVSAVYLPRAIAQYAKMNVTYVKHEFLDDVDNNQWDQEHFFGMIATPSVDPTTWVKKPEFYTMQRFYNLLKDRGNNATVVPNHATQDLPFTVETNASQLRYLKTQKSDGSWWVMVWRDVNVWDINIVNNSPGRELAVAPVDFRIRLNQGRTVQAWQPNKSSSRGVGSTASWSTIPAAEESWTVPQGGGTFTVSLKGDLKVLKIQ